ncbi:MAG: hypothetical protein RBU45_25710 [Myxococcota bacterium]|nr:hypothetical protein [Myxococcota bacterium]
MCWKRGKRPESGGKVQAEAEHRQAEDRERFGGWLRRSRKEPGRLRLARGKRRGDFLDELATGVAADRSYLSWILSLPDLPDEARQSILAAQGSRR